MSSLDQADADPFPAIYKDVRCPRCNLNYSDGDRTPLLLLCGHAVCERCCGKFSHIVCGVCSEKTVLAAGEEKSKHFYTFGLIHDTCSKSRGHGGRTRARKPVDNIIFKSAIKKPLIKDPCDECLLAKATVQCRQCWIEVCLPCFNKIHAPWALRKHKPEALIVPVAARSCLVPDCLDHSQNLATILCISCSDEGSEMYICTTCQRSRKHEGHKFLDIASPTPNLTEFRSVASEMEAHLQLLRERVEMCYSFRQKALQYRDHEITRVRTYMQRLHGLLQMQERTILSKIFSLSNRLQDDLLKEQADEEKEIDKCDSVLKYGGLLVNGEAPSVNFSKFLGEFKRILNSVSQPILDSHAMFFKCQLSEGLEHTISDCITVEEVSCTIRALEDSLTGFSKTSSGSAVGAINRHDISIKKEEISPRHSKTDPAFVSRSNGGVAEIQDLLLPESLAKGVGDRKAEMPSSRSKSAKMSALELISSAKPPENYAMISDLQQMCSNENGTDLLSHRTPDQGGIVLQPLKEELDVIESHPCREERTEILVKIESDDAGTAAQSFQEVNAQNHEDNLLSVANETSSSQGTVLMDDAWISSGARPKVTKAVDSLLNESDSTNSIRTFPLTRTLSSDSKLHFPPSCDQNSETSSKNLPLLLEEHVKIAFVESPSLFYVQRSVDFSWIVSLGHKLNRIAREEPRTVETVPLVGKLYICCFTADEKWYRALALSVLPDSQEVVVEYVDYGNNETIKTSRLRECPPPYQLENLPPFCMACSLWEIIPARGDCWDAEAVEIFCDLVKDISLQLYVIDCETVQDTNKCLVDLRRPGRTVGIANDLPLSIREVLIFLGYGIYVNKSPQDQYKKKMTPMRSYHRPELPFGKCDTEVLVCHVKSPNEFYLQLKSNCDCLTSLMNELQSHYNSPSIVGNLDWHIFAPKIGMLCVAKYSGDEKWYRAIIVDLPGYRKVDVFYVDFGNQERLWYKQVNKVADRFALLPMQAVPCSLLDIEPCGERWVPNIAVLMTGILESQKILVMFHSYEDEKALVNLSAQSDACKIIDCGDRLIQMGLAKSSFKRHKKLHSKKLGSQKWTQVDVKNGVQKQETLAEVKERGGYISRSKEDVTCLAVTSPSCIHLRLTSISTAFKELQGKLIQEMQNVTSSNISPEIGDVCIARCKPSGYARVKVLEVTDEEFLVHFVDCGGIQKVKQADLFKLPEGLAEIKPLSLSVRLADIIPPGGQMAWPGITKDCLEELLSSKDILYMTPQGDAEQHPDFKIEVIPAYVEFTEEKLGGPFEANSVSFVSVNELLIQEGLALPCQVRGHSPAQSRPYSEEERTSEIPCVSSKRELTTPDLNDAVAQKERDQSMPSYDEANISRYPSGWIPCELPESTVFVAYPSYVDDRATIYLQPLKNMGTLLTMSEAFSILVANSLPSDDDLCWSIGDPVIARFFIDNKWHRATVLKLLEKGNVLVQFVDYGNTDVVMLSDLRRSIVYDQVPIQCCKAVLYQTEPRNMQGCWQTEVLDFLHKSVVEKECLVTVMEKPRPGEPLQVRLLVKEHNLDVISLLVNKMKVCRIVKPMLSLEEDSCDVVVEDDTSQMDFPVVNLPSLSLPNNPFEKFRVKVTAIKDPASVYISPVSSNGTREYECLLQSSVAAYQSFFSLVNSNPSPYARVKDPQIGEIYLGMFSTEEWYRVQIIAKTRYQITAMFVDTGNLEDIAIKNLRECPEIGLNIPAMAVGVKLHQVVPPNQSRNMWSEEAMRAMIDCLMNTNEKSFLTSVKKKALQALKAPKQEPEPLVPLKRPMEAKDAKEMAKKLIKSGAIKVPERPQAATEKTTFKRSMGLERKLSAADKAPSGYQPFSTTHPEEEIHESRVKVKQNLYDSFVSARDREERGEFTRDGRGSDGKPRHGHTIYVFGFSISEDVLKKAFSTFGNIVNVNMEIDKNCGFVTFDKVESAEKAIADMNGSMVSGIQLKVSLARRQPVIDPINDASSSATWSTIAASHSQKGSHKDKRDLVAYDDDLFG